MVDELQVKNLALIKNATLSLNEGLTVLTGETGAGKTALLTALKLLMGSRAQADSVRDGESSLEVLGRFYIPSKSESQEQTVQDILDSAEKCTHSLEGKNFAEEEGVVVSRRVGADGRSRVAINGKMVSVKELAAQIGTSIDLCGQHEQQQLMRTQNHIHMLDAWAAAEVEGPLAQYREAFKQAKAAAEQLAKVEAAQSASNAKLDEARYTLTRIEEVSPKPGEYEELAARLARAENAESLAVAANTAHEALGAEGGALDGVNTAISALQGAAQHDKQLGSFAEQLVEATFALEDVSRSTGTYLESVEFDPQALEADQQRMAAFQGLMRTFGPGMGGVFDAWDDAKEVLALANNSGEQKAAAQKAVDEAENALVKAANALDAVRKKVAPRFAATVNQQLLRLEMSGASLECAFQPLERKAWGTTGPCELEFLFRPGAQMQARPLVRIASGGELSRVMLAIKVVMGSADKVDTLVFDEVDAGVGGSVANALAGVIESLAKTHQVIVVTHLAQVAVRAKTHYLIKKVDGESGMPETKLHLLNSKERPAEIARMLSGSVTEASLAHANEMLSTNCE